MIQKQIRRLVVTSLIVLTSCTSFELESSVGKNPKGQTNGSATIHGSFWWFDYWTNPEVTICETGYEIQRIETHQNALYFLTSLVTLGLYVPQDVEWWCVEKPKKKKPGRRLQDDPNRD